MTVATEGGHWYTRTGEPMHEVPAKSGGMRPTNLRDARKLNLVPSVSGIMGVAAAPALETWNIKQALLTSTAYPRISGESDDAYISRVLAANREKLDHAPNLGSAIHGCIEKYLCDKQFDLEFKPHVDGAIAALDKWCGLDGIATEKSFAHELGYGGKVDIHKITRPGFGFVADFKTKPFDESSLPKVYDNHAIQPAAYREGLNIPHARCAIIFVSTRVPGLTHTVEIPQNDLGRGWDMFKCLLKYWKLKNRYMDQEDEYGLLA